MNDLKPLDRILVLGILLTAIVAPGVAQDAILFDDQHWDLSAARVVEHLGRSCLQGTAMLKDVVFQDGVIETDIALSGQRSYPAIIFRSQSEMEREEFYLRPHRAGLYPDALQYAPVFNGVACWQLYHGKGFTAGATLPAETWIHVKMEIQGTEARIYLSDAPGPALHVRELKHGISSGAIGLRDSSGSGAYFSNFRWRPAEQQVADDVKEQDENAASESSTFDPGLITEWEVSKPYSTASIQGDQYPSFFAIFDAEWRRVTPELSGLVNLSKLYPSTSSNPQSVYARTIVRSNRPQTIRFAFGYSDDAVVFLNGEPVFAGRNGYRSRDPSFTGVIGFNDVIYLELEKGLNEICLLVADSFGGWGFMAKSDQTPRTPLKQHEAVRKLWETPAEFKIPESVLFDSKRDVFYVSSYARAPGLGVTPGFISKLAPTGNILELNWITDLEGPCGMGMHGDKLYVVESTGKLVEIDADAGRVLKKYAVDACEFLNDLVVDTAGTVYITNSSRAAGAADLFCFRDDRFETLRTGYNLCRANGICFDGDSLLVGNTAGGLLKRVDPATGYAESVTSIGAGIVDGIRIDKEGNYLVSHWEGQLYRVSPNGEIVELLDLAPERLNCADFEYVADKNLLVIPTFLGNKVVAYEIVE